LGGKNVEKICVWYRGSISVSNSRGRKSFKNLKKKSPRDDKKKRKGRHLIVERDTKSKRLENYTWDRPGKSVRPYALKREKKNWHKQHIDLALDGK